MGGNSGGGGKGGRKGGGGGGARDAQQPGEVFRAAQSTKTNDQLKKALGKNISQYKKLETGVSNLEKTQSEIERSGPTGPGSRNHELNNQLTRAIITGMNKKAIIRTRLKNIVARRGKPT
jgi:hypothetical protein